MRAAPAIGAFAMALTGRILAANATKLAKDFFGASPVLESRRSFSVCPRRFGFRWLMLFIAGALDSVSVIIRGSIVQLVTPDEMRGRVSAVNNIFIGTSNEFGALESGLTAALFGPVISVVGGGIGTILVVLGAAWRWPEIRKIGALDRNLK